MKAFIKAFQSNFIKSFLEDTQQNFPIRGGFFWIEEKQQRTINNLLCLLACLVVKASSLMELVKIKLTFALINYAF